jgi:hypothetical protein
MSTIKASNIQNGSSASVNIALNTDGSATFAQMPVPPSPYAMRNKIINGAMEIDQRNGGAAVTPTANAYTVDRFYLFMSQASKLTGQQNLDGVTPPTGYKNYLGVKIAATATVGAADCFGLAQRVEGFNCVDLAYGTAQAKTLTLSFWVRSSVTGTFSGAFQNDGLNRSYPFTYAISNANTWEFKTITFVGDVTGTWLTTNSTGFIVEFSFGAGANFSGTAGAWNGNNNNAATGGTSLMGTLNATWYVTGVQLEVGSVATPFERRLYPQEWAMCQRYYEANNALWSFNGANTVLSVSFRTTKRAAPTISVATSGGATVSVSGGYTGTDAFRVSSSGASDFTWTASAEL